MAPDDPSGARPQPVALRIKLKYDDVDTLVARFAPNVGKSGLFLPTKSLQAVGAEVKFELRLSDDKIVITGLGRVKSAKAPDPASPRATFGMSIELMRVTRESRDVIMKILAKRKELGLAEVAIPRAEDIDAARAQIESGARESALSGVPSAVPLIDSGPVLESAPVIVASPPTSRVMTAPRRSSGSVPIQNLAAASPLAPEPARKKRPGLAEIMDRASGPVVVATTVPGLDDDIDVAKVLARARTLAVGDLDAELESLRESAAAPLAISVEAASAELARQLGGAAVSKDRSAKWAPPPPIVEEAVVPQISADAAALIAQATSLPAIVPPPVEPEPEPEPVLDMARPSEPAIPIRDSEPVLEELHQLDDGDFEEVDHTVVGASDELERSLEQTLEAAEQEADADDLGIPAILDDPPTLDPVGAANAFSEEPARAFEARPMRFSTAPVVDADSERSELGAQPTLAGYVAPETYTKPIDLNPPDIGPGEDDDVDDFEILAESEADEDAELIPPPRPTIEDFADRLELSDLHSQAPEQIGEDEGTLDPHLAAGADAALAAFDTPDPSEEEDSTIEPPVSFPPLNSFDESDVAISPAPQPMYLRARRPSSASVAQAAPSRAKRNDGYDLETALEALDVDLDDMSEIAPPPQPAPVLHPRRSTSQQRPVTPSNPIPTRVPSRPSTDDGVLIDFDDDDE